MSSKKKHIEAQQQQFDNASRKTAKPKTAGGEYVAVVMFGIVITVFLLIAMAAMRN